MRLVTLSGPAGVGKSCLAIAAASHLFERRWYPDGCVRVELRGRTTEAEALTALNEALDLELNMLQVCGTSLRSQHATGVWDIT